MSNYKYFDHTADIGVEVLGRTAEFEGHNTELGRRPVVAPIHINNVSETKKKNS